MDNFPSNTSARYRQLVISLLGDHCQMCKSENKLVIDHIRPLSMGGSNCKNNVQLLCGSCNSAKTSIDKAIIYEYIKKNGPINNKILSKNRARSKKWWHSERGQTWVKKYKKNYYLKNKHLWAKYSNKGEV